jgi:hypothetical protein
MPLEIDYVPGVGQPTVTVRVEQTQPVQTWVLPLPAGATASGIGIDPRKWNLLQVTRIRRDNNFILGQAEDALAPTLAVYPNPCTSHLTLTPAPQPRTAEVLDLAGRVVYRTTLAATAEHVPTASLAAGTYVLRLTEAGQTFARQVRFSKQ